MKIYSLQVVFKNQVKTFTITSGRSLKEIKADAKKEFSDALKINLIYVSDTTY